MSDRVRYWRRRMAEFESSGLSRAAFCRRRRLNYHTMTYWIKRLVNLDGPRTDGEATSFVEVSLPTAVSAASYEVLLGNDRSIRFSADFDSDTLARICQAVEPC